MSEGLVLQNLRVTGFLIAITYSGTAQNMIYWIK